MQSKGCSVEEYLKGDDDLPICTDLDCDTWDSNFLSQLGEDHEDVSEDEEDITMIDETPQPPILKIQTYKEALKSLEDVQQFLESRGHIEEALSLGSSIDRVAYIQLQCTSQTTIHDYFS